MRRRSPRTWATERTRPPRGRPTRVRREGVDTAAPEIAAVAPAVSIEGLELRHPGGPVVLHIDELSIARARVVALVGPNGSGKSTLIAALAGLLTPAAGAISVNGATPVGQGRDIAVVFQAAPSTAGLPLTVREVVAMGRFPHRGLIGTLRVEDRTAVDESLARLDVADLASRQLEELSGGQRQRVLVARALAQQAQVLLLDEPTTGLDMNSRDRILEVIADERRRGTTVVMATHQLDDAVRSADEVALLASRLIAHGPPEHVLCPDVLHRAYVPSASLPPR